MKEEVSALVERINEVPVFNNGTTYLNGYRVEFEGKIYKCRLPQGVHEVTGISPDTISHWKVETGIKSTDITFNRIYKYFHSKSKVELSSLELEILARWEKAWLLLCRHRTRNAVSDILIKLFNVSKGTAYDDIRNAMNLFSDPREDMKAAKRAIAEDALLKGADRAWKTGDLKMHKEYMKEYSEINGLKEESADASQAEFFKNYKPTQIIIVAKRDDIQNEIEKLQREVTLDITHDEG